MLNDVPLPEMGEDEEAMLSESILCQIKQSIRLPNSITKILEGLELELAQKIKSVTCKCDAFFLIILCSLLRLDCTFFISHR
jgi:hypothetical protein